MGVIWLVIHCKIPFLIFIQAKKIHEIAVAGNMKLLVYCYCDKTNVMNTSFAYIKYSIVY